MSKIHKDKCDQCGNESVDRNSEQGWISTETISTGVKVDITMHHGRKKDKSAKLKHTRIDGKDFCSRKCFENFLDKHLV